MKKNTQPFVIEKATIADAKEIQVLIKAFAAKQQMLSRPLQSIYENIRSFFVCRNRKGDVIGCSALEVVWEDLAEIRSLAVNGRYQKKGIGRQLVEICLEEAVALKVKKVFTLTYVAGFFSKIGFAEVDKHELPHKIWTDCINCPHFPDCNEVAMIRSL